jgi:hypothetical protein
MPNGGEPGTCGYRYLSALRDETDSPGETRPEARKDPGLAKQLKAAHRMTRKCALPSLA